jgi:glycosyltransferase involved in cell wall biosynthesis
MKILWIVNKEMDISTSQASRLALAKALTSLGHQVTIVARYRYKPQALRSDLDVKFLPGINLPGLRTLSFFAILWVLLPLSLLHARPDIVILDRPSLVWVSFPWSFLFRIFSVRWVLDVRSLATETKGLSGTLSKLACNSGLWLAGKLMHGWMTITPALRDQVSRLGKIPQHKIAIWSSGVDPEIFSPTGRKLPDDWQLNGHFVVVYHGLLSADRALPEAIEALSLIHEDAPELRLFLLGAGPDKERLQHKVEELGLAAKVIFHDMVSHTSVPDYINAANVGLVPAPDTPWYQVSSPLKLMEYLAMGKPVIVTDIVANRMVLKGRGDAVYVACENGTRPSPSELANALLESYRRFSGVKYSGKNRQIVVDEYSWDRLSQDVERYLASFLQVKSNVQY